MASSSLKFLTNWTLIGILQVHGVVCLEKQCSFKFVKMIPCWVMCRKIGSRKSWRSTKACFRAESITGGDFGSAVVCRGDRARVRRCLIILVENRNANTIAQILIQHILPGSLIVKDQWRAYRRAISDLGLYDHATVKYSLHFVDTESPEFKQNILNSGLAQNIFAEEKRNYTRKKAVYLIQIVFEYSVEKR
jgi:hypothetical protein